MTRTVTDLYKQAAELSEADRAALAGLLLESLDQASEPGVAEAWQVEIERRVMELEQGSAKTIPWHEVQQNLLKHLNG